MEQIKLVIHFKFNLTKLILKETRETQTRRWIIKSTCWKGWTWTKRHSWTTNKTWKWNFKLEQQSYFTFWRLEKTRKACWRGLISSDHKRFDLIIHSLFTTILLLSSLLSWFTRFDSSIHSSSLFILLNFLPFWF